MQFNELHATVGRIKSGPEGDGDEESGNCAYEGKHSRQRCVPVIAGGENHQTGNDRNPDCE